MKIVAALFLAAMFGAAGAIAAAYCTLERWLP